MQKEHNPNCFSEKLVARKKSFTKQTIITFLKEKVLITTTFISFFRLTIDKASLFNVWANTVKQLRLLLTGLRKTPSHLNS